MKEIKPKRSAASWLAELAKGRYGEYALSVLTALLQKNVTMATLWTSLGIIVASLIVTIAINMKDSFYSRIPCVNIRIQCLHHEGVEEAPKRSHSDDQCRIPQGVGTGQITGSVEHSGVRLLQRNASQQPIVGSHQYIADCAKNAPVDELL